MLSDGTDSSIAWAMYQAVRIAGQKAYDNELHLVPVYRDLVKVELK
jgi:hypothetical protein